MENHSDISKNFIPYELTLKLKDIGFNSGNEYCFGFYTEEYKKLVKGYNRLPIDLPTNSFEAPLWQQAFYWFLFEKEWYKEARLDCLEKLIEIIKEKENGKNL